MTDEVFDGYHNDNRLITDFGQQCHNSHNIVDGIHGLSALSVQSILKS